MKIFNFLLFLFLGVKLFAQWSSVLELEDHNLLALTFSDDSLGYAVGNDIIAKTNDGGVTWNTDTSRYGYFQFVDFVNKDTGYICCNPEPSGLLLATHDGGENWFNTELSANSIEAIDFTQTDRGAYAIGPPLGGYPSLLIVADNDLTDLVSYTPLPISLYWQIRFITKDTGFLSGDSYDDSGGSIFKTTDKGLTWNTDAEKYGPVYYFSFGSSRVGYGVGYENYLWKTDDYGDTWHPTPDAFGTLYGHIFFANDTVGYAEIAPSTIAKTTDGANTWTITDFPDIDEGITSIYCLNQDTCFVVTNYHIYRTTNGGGIASVNNLISNNEIKIYPNPANSNISFQLQNISQSGINIETINLVGEKININWQQTNNSFDADISLLPKGIYFTSVNDDEKKFVGKWVKM